jgi:hypothetical protein
VRHDDKRQERVRQVEIRETEKESSDRVAHETYLQHSREQRCPAQILATARHADGASCEEQRQHAHGDEQHQADIALLTQHLEEYAVRVVEPGGVRRVDTEELGRKGLKATAHDRVIAREIEREPPGIDSPQRRQILLVVRDVAHALHPLGRHEQQRERQREDTERPGHELAGTLEPEQPSIAIRASSAPRDWDPSTESTQSPAAPTSPSLSQRRSVMCQMYQSRGRMMIIANAISLLPAMKVGGRPEHVIVAAREQREDSALGTVEGDRADDHPDHELDPPTVVDHHKHHEGHQLNLQEPHQLGFRDRRD